MLQQSILTCNRMTNFLSIKTTGSFKNCHSTESIDVLLFSGHQNSSSTRLDLVHTALREHHHATCSADPQLTPWALVHSTAAQTRSLLPTSTTCLHFWALMSQTSQPVPATPCQVASAEGDHQWM